MINTLKRKYLPANTWKVNWIICLTINLLPVPVLLWAEGTLTKREICAGTQHIMILQPLCVWIEINSYKEVQYIIDWDISFFYTTYIQWKATMEHPKIHLTWIEMGQTKQVHWFTSMHICFCFMASYHLFDVLLGTHSQQRKGRKFLLSVNRLISIKYNMQGQLIQYLAINQRFGDVSVLTR